MKKKILIFAAGPAGREVFQLVSSINKLKNEWEIIGYVDDDPIKVGTTVDGVQVYSNKNKPVKREMYATCGLMNHKIRKKIFNEEIIKSGYQITNLIHPLIEKPKCFKIGNGNIVFGNIHISFEVTIKNFSIISNFCDLAHNLITYDYVTIMPSAIIGGNCEIGENTLIGAGARIHQGTKIGKNCKIGMGTLILNNVKNNTAVVDFPRKVQNENK